MVTKQCILLPMMTMKKNNTSYSIKKDIKKTKKLVQMGRKALNEIHKREDKGWVIYKDSQTSMHSLNTTKKIILY